MAAHISILVIICIINVTNARLVIDENSRNTFDIDLYQRVLNLEQCDRQMQYIRQNATNLYGRFLDAGFRIPRGIFTLSTTDLGNYHQCLGINEQVLDMTVEGKYCLLRIPLNQNLTLPIPIEDFYPQPDLRNKRIVSFHNGIDSKAQKFAIGDDVSSGRVNMFSIEFTLAVCIPKVCTSEDWIRHNMFNIPAMGFQFEENFCRLPNDKPWVAADYVAIGIFSFIALLTAISTLYDVNHTLILKKDPKQALPFCRIFSIYTNTKRLCTFSPDPNALVCLDGIRGVSLMWVIMGHVFMMDNFNYNIIDAVTWISSGGAVWITTAVLAVDTFFMMTGLLLVYTSVGKMTNISFIKRLHLFYLHRLLRMFPLLAALVLLEASVFHRMADGPYWVIVAEHVQRCRNFWWTTLLHIQNYVNPNNLCVPHSWYIAIDVQLYIVSPLVLFWVLGNNRKIAWTALVSGLLAILVASTTWNFIKEMPSSMMPLARIHEIVFYMENFYKNTLTRAAPFFVGMIVGYILVIYKGKQIKLNMGFVLSSWVLALGLIASCFYFSYVIMQADWDNQVGDSIFNSFVRFVWSIGLGWIIFACTKGYGGPIHWFLSHPVWRVPARISYAMYLYHYPLMFVVAGTQISPQYFSPGARMYNFMAFLVITLLVAIVMTIIIDAPFSTITKVAMGRGQRKRKTSVEQVGGLPNGSLTEKNMTEVPNSPDDDLRMGTNDHAIIDPAFDNNRIIIEKNDHNFERNLSLDSKNIRDI